MKAPAVAVLALLLWAAPLAAQAASAASAAPPPVKRAAVARTMLGDAAIVVNARTDGRIEVGAAGEARTVELKFPWGPVATWADSAGKLMRARPRPKKGDTLAWRAELEQPERGGGMTLTRRATGNQSTYAIFFADSSFGGFTVPVTAEEANILVNTMRRAVTQARSLSAPPKDTAAKSPATTKPAAKAPASTAKPPAKKTPAR